MRMRIALVLAATALAALAGPATALDEVSRGWTQVDYTENGACRAEVRSNGQVYRIAGQGVRPGEQVHLSLHNADLRPVERSIVANDQGRWRDFYMPFVWHRDGGTVDVALASTSCSLNLSFDWARRRQ